MSGPADKHDCSQCLVLRVRGLDCAEEVAILRSALGGVIEHEHELSFDLMRGTLTVHRAPHARDDGAIVRAVQKTGMHAAPYSAEREDAPDASTSRWADPWLLRLTAVSGAGLALGYGAHMVSAGPWAAFTGEVEPPWFAAAAFLVASAVTLRHTLPKALVALRFLRPDMHLLMSIAIIGAVLLGEFAESATVAFLFLVSLLLESWNLERARRSVSSLMQLAPATARVRCPHDGDLMDRPVAVVAPGSIVVVRPGERIPLDGVIVAGESLIDQSPMTGESVPVARGMGEDVLAATINQTGLLEIRVTKAASDSTIARMLRMIEEARARRAPAEQWVDQFARWYTPIVIALALGIALAPPLLAGADWSDWIYRGLVVLVIACPCALVISTPVALTAALSCAARRGVLIKGGLYLEQMASVRGIALDKTGTLTKGTPEVLDCLPAASVSEEHLLRTAAALEAGAHHPLAQAILRYAEAKGIEAPLVAGHRAQHGFGVQAELDGAICWAGSATYATQWLPQQALPPLPEEATPVFVGCGAQLLGLLLLRDTVRPQAISAVRELQSIHGIAELRILTGDSAKAAAPIAREAGINQVNAALTPEDKVHTVEEMVRRLGSVAMAGDGVNDAPALAAATVGIAMGAVGSDAALETADIALMNDDIARLPWLIHHARATRAIVLQNLVFALGSKAVVLGLAAIGAAGLWAAIAADTGASLLVTLNALRLLYRK